MNNLTNVTLIDDFDSVIENNLTRQNNDGVSFNELFHLYNTSGGNSSSEIGFRDEIDKMKGQEYPLISTTLLMSYLICVNGIGLILNLMVILCLVRKSLNGIFALLLQMAVSDILSLTIVAIPEMWAHHGGTWTFGAEMCILYLGGEVFVSTTNVYFLIAITFHAIACANLIIQTVNTDKDSEEELLEDISENKSSRHSLVSRDESALPSRLTKSKSLNKSSIPVILPIILVWILAASLSIPEFALSTLVDSKIGPTICTYIEGTHMISMQTLLSVFQLLIPFVILIATCSVIAYQMCKMSSKYTNAWGDSCSILKLSLFLCCVYLILDVPRALLSALHVIKNEQNVEEISAIDHFRIPPLNSSVAPVSVPFILSFLHFISPVVKPISYVLFLRGSKYSVIPNCLIGRPKGDSL